MIRPIQIDLLDAAVNERRHRRALWLLAVAGAFVLGVMVGLASPGIVPLEREVAEAEQACAAHKREFYAVYVVSRWGSLRGCLLVPEWIPPSMKPKVVFIREGAPQ